MTELMWERPLLVENETGIKAAAVHAKRRRTLLLRLTQLGVAVVIFGGWQWFTTEGWLDPFFYGQPSGIWHSLDRLFTKGTEFGSIWDDLGVTLREAVYGFALGAVVGVLVGLVLGLDSRELRQECVRVAHAAPAVCA